MNFNSDTLIGFLSGSLAGLLIKFILEEITSRQNFNRELKKISFIRKLEKAENAIALHLTYINKLNEIQKSLELAIAIFEEFEETNLDLGGFQELIEKNSIFLNELSSEKYIHINAMYLYFEIEEDVEGEENLEKMLVVLAELGGQNTEIKYWSDLENKATNDGNEKLAEYYWQKLKDCLPNHIITLGKFISSIKETRLSSKTLITQIKKQMKTR